VLGFAPPYAHTNGWRDHALRRMPAIFLVGVCAAHGLRSGGAQSAGAPWSGRQALPATHIQYSTIPLQTRILQGFVLGHL